MSFLPLNNIAKIDNNTDIPKFGTVIYNNDPERLGRIKVKLTGIFEPTDEIGSNLPWVRQLTDTFLCGNNCEMFSVPEIGSVVEIKWAFDNRTPFYTGAPYSQKHKTNAFDEDYPNSWGFCNNDFIFKINETQGIFTLSFNNSTITISKDGTINIASDNVNVKSKNANIKSDSVTIDSSSVIIGNNTKIDNVNFLSHTHSSGNQGQPTGGVII